MIDVAALRLPSVGRLPPVGASRTSVQQFDQVVSNPPLVNTSVFSESSALWSVLLLQQHQDDVPEARLDVPFSKIGL